MDSSNSEFKDNEEPNITSISFDDIMTNFIYIYPESNYLFHHEYEHFEDDYDSRNYSHDNLDLIQLLNYINSSFDNDEQIINRVEVDSFLTQPDSLIKTDRDIIISSQKFETIIESMQKDNIKCCICFDDFEKKSDISVTNCKHVFHTYCIKEWGKYKIECPICRQKLE